MPQFTIPNETPVEILRLFKDHSKYLIRQEDIMLFQKWILGDYKKYRYPMVSIDTFIDHPDFLGVGDFIYPEVRRITKEIVSGDWVEALFVAGIGSGKSVTSQVLAVYNAYKLLCLRNPFSFYKLIKDKPIAIINMGPTASQALNVTFAGIKKFIENSPWFRGFTPTILGQSIRFVEDGLYLFSGNSKSTTALGYNVFCGILDEAAFYLDNDNKNVAEEIYASLQRRIVSRFGMDGLLVMISSPRYEQDFVMKTLEESKLLKNRYYAQLPTWKCKPLEKQDVAGKFFFNTKSGRIITPEEAIQINDTTFLSDETFDSEKIVWEIPGDYLNSFKADGDKAKRDFGAVPSKSLQAFLPHVDLVNKIFNGKPSPVKKEGGYVFDARPLRKEYFIHVDLALNKNGKGDKAGFAMAHVDEVIIEPETGYRKKKIVVDLAEQILAGPTGEILFSDVRNRIYALKAMGYSISLCTFDNFQSAEMHQILKRYGIKTDYVSVDRTIDPYQCLKEFIYMEALECHDCPELREELIRLELKKGMKVDHPPNFSKDLADAVTGAVYNAHTHGATDFGITSVSSNSAPSKKIFNPYTPPTSRDSDADRIEYYRKLQQMVDDGIIK